MLADEIAACLGCTRHCHADRARVDMPHPDPPLKGREFFACAVIGIIDFIAIAQPRRVAQCVVIPAEAGIHILGGR